jgi:signal transduction histidine kinase/ActR/RegA family two-component response regulator
MKKISGKPARATPARRRCARRQALWMNRPGAPDADGERARGGNWEFVLDANFALRFEMPGPKMLEVISVGALDESHVARIFDYHEAVFAQCPLEDNNYYYISDVAGLRQATLKARRRFYDQIRAWHALHPFRVYVFHGVNRFIRAAINVARHFVDFEVVIVNDREAAIDFILRRESNQARPAGPMPAATSVREAGQTAPMAGYIEEILQYLGQVSWDTDSSHDSNQFSPDHPFSPVFEAIDLVKNDFDEIIGERDDALAELEERNAFIETVAGSLPVGLLVSRMQDGRLIYANSRFTEICGRGLESSHTLGGFVEQALARPDLKSSLASLGEAGWPDVNTRLEWANLPLAAAGGAQKHVTLVTVPMIAQGLLITTVMDVSDRVRVESEKVKLQADLFQAQKMEAIGTLAGGIAHDFNNVLAAIMGFVEMALFDISENDPVRGNLDQVLKASHRARELVKQILAFSRRDVGLQKRQRVAPLVEESLNLIRASLPTSIAIRKRLESPEGIARIDATQIQQVLLNLCANAAHAMEEDGGVLEIRLCEQQMDEAAAEAVPHVDPGSYLRLTVADTGKGITEDILQRIFDPFFTTKAMGKGTGMGLSVVHGIVRAHGGAVQVESVLGKGSRFHIYLPRVSEACRRPEAEEKALAGGKEHILFVDDEVMLTDMGRQMLERLGYRVTTRTSSIEALEAFRAHPQGFDLVISDMTMPNLTGDRLARSLLAIRADLPIILCTGFSSLMTASQAEEMGIKAYLAKPLSSRELARAVRDILDARPGE